MSWTAMHNHQSSFPLCAMCMCPERFRNALQHLTIPPNNWRWCPLKVGQSDLKLSPNLVKMNYVYSFWQIGNSIRVASLY